MVCDRHISVKLSVHSSTDEQEPSKGLTPFSPFSRKGIAIGNDRFKKRWKR